MGELLFSHFRVTNVELINEKISLNITVSKSHGLRHSVTFFFVFSLLCCKYIYDIYLSMLLMAYGSSIAYLFTRLQKTFGSCEPKEE